MSGASHILVSAGGLSLAIESACVHCIHDGLKTQSEEGTQKWFLGLAVADDRLLPVTDLGAYLNHGSSLGRVLEVTKRLGLAGLKIDEVHGVSNKAPTPLDKEFSVATQTEPALQALSIEEDGVRYQLLDIVQLMQSSRFLHVALTPA